MKAKAMILSTLMTVLGVGLALDVNASSVNEENPTVVADSSGRGDRGDRGRGDRSRGESNFDRDTQEYYESRDKDKDNRDYEDEDEDED